MMTQSTSRSASTPVDQMVRLSVHSLPDPSGSPADAARTRLGRWKMLLVLLVCAAPVVASYFTYYVVRPDGRTNHGTLIQPSRALPSAQALPLQDLTGRAVEPATLKGQWLLVTVAGGACDAACENKLYMQRQLRESLGKDKDRLDRVWLIDDGQPMRASLQAAMQGATVLKVPRAALSTWLQPEADQPLEAHWYLVDPMGQWMMRFPAQAEPRKVLKDLTRLMRASAGWDEAGRP
jgi:hypothetical protein